MHALRRTLALAGLTTLLTAPAFAQRSASPADRAMMGGMETMNRDMAAAPMTGDPDQDFVAMMIPHHQGAIDMARIELHYSKDPALRRMARGIVGAQEKEIGEMRSWQTRHPLR